MVKEGREEEGGKDVEGTEIRRAVKERERAGCANVRRSELENCWTISGQPASRNAVLESGCICYVLAQPRYIEVSWPKAADLSFQLLIIEPVAHVPASRRIRKYSDSTR